MFRERVAAHYRARGYRVEEDVRLRASDGRVHVVDLLCSHGLGKLVVEVPDEPLDGTEMAGLKRKAKDFQGTPVLAAARIAREVRNLAPKLGVVLLEEVDLQTEPEPMMLPPAAPQEPTPWPERKKVERSASVWPSERRQEAPAAPEGKFAWLQGGPAMASDVPAEAPVVPDARPRQPRFTEPPVADMWPRTRPQAVMEPPVHAPPVHAPPVHAPPVQAPPVHAPPAPPVLAPPAHLLGHEPRGVLEASLTLDIPTIPLGEPDAVRAPMVRAAPRAEPTTRDDAHVPDPRDLLANEQQALRAPAPLLTVRQVAQAAVGGLVAGLVILGLGFLAF